MAAILITKSPVTSNFNIVSGNLELTDYYGSANIYFGTYQIPDSGVIGCFKVTAPDGTVIYNNTNFSSPDVVGATATWTKNVAIPVNSDNTLVEGVYTIVYTTHITDGLHTMYVLSNQATYDFEYVAPTIVITQTVDCISPNFTTIDTTDYVVNGITPTITRTMTLNYPVGSAGFGSPLTTSTTTISTGVFYQNTQTTEVSSVLIYTNTATGDFPTYTVSDTIEATKEIVVDCTFICAIYCCIRSLEQRMQNAEGVNDVLFETYTAEFNKVMAFVALTKLAIECGKSTEVAGYLAEIRAITLCTSDCDCTDDAPSLVVGLGGSSINVVVASGGSPVVVSAATVGSTRTYTVTLDQSFIDTVTDSYNTIVTSVDSSITVSASGTNPKTYDLAVALPDPEQKVVCKFTIIFPAIVTGAGDISMTVDPISISGTKFNAEPLLEAADDTDPNFVNLNNAFKVSDFYVTSPTNDYVVMLTSSLEANALSLSILKILQGSIACDIFGRDDANGVFYFRFTNIVSGSTITPTFKNMNGFKFEISVSIQDPT